MAMKARIPPSAADKRTISQAVIDHNKQYRELITKRLIFAAMIAANEAFGIGAKRMEKFKATLLQVLAESADMYDDVMETGLEKACQARGIDTEL